MVQHKQKHDVHETEHALADLEKHRQEVQMEKQKLVERIAEVTQHPVSQSNVNRDRAFTSETGIPSSATAIISADDTPNFYSLMQENTMRLFEIQAEFSSMFLKMWWSVPSFWSMALNNRE